MEKLKFLIIPVMFIYFLVQNDNYSPQKIKLLPLQGDKLVSVITQGDALGVGASALSGRVGLTCESSISDKEIALK